MGWQGTKSAQYPKGLSPPQEIILTEVYNYITIENEIHPNPYYYIKFPFFNSLFLGRRLEERRILVWGGISGCFCNYMRKFETGATRDTAEGKPDYAGYISPLVIKRFGEYMLRHQKQADGTMRGSDNWKSLFGEEHANVCFQSLWRHFLDLWLFHEGHAGRDTIDDSINGALFNLMAYQHKRLLDEENDTKRNN